MQAATGLVAIAVLLLVMNWFFHRVYWTGWISHHNRTKKGLLALTGPGAERKIFAGLAVLGFASVYREGFEVVLFLQSMRLSYGSATVLQGVAVGLALVAVVAAITFLNHHRLPYRRMLVVTGAMLGVVLVVMVGEQVQEMQQAGWIGTTTHRRRLPELARHLVRDVRHRPGTGGAGDRGRGRARLVPDRERGAGATSDTPWRPSVERARTRAPDGRGSRCQRRLTRYVPGANGASPSRSGRKRRADHTSSTATWLIGRMPYSARIGQRVSRFTSVLFAFG